MELLKYVYFYAQKSIIKAGNNKFQDLINAPRMALRRNNGKLSLKYFDKPILLYLLTEDRSCESSHTTKTQLITCSSLTLWKMTSFKDAILISTKSTFDVEIRRISHFFN